MTFDLKDFKLAPCERCGQVWSQNLLMRMEFFYEIFV
jgi:hypothetical protein